MRKFSFDRSKHILHCLTFPLYLVFKKNLLYIIVGLLFLSLSTFVHSQETLMGLTSNGGPQGKGTAFTIKTTGASFTILKQFADWGKNPSGGLLQGSDGNYYGMTNNGGTLINGSTIFKMTPAGAVTILRQMNYATDGSFPYGSLVKGYDGAFYGLTSAGGSFSGGTIFKITTSGVFTVVKHFALNDGQQPHGDLVLAPDSSFYGVTYRRGSTGNGTIFKFNPKTLAYTVLKSPDAITEGQYFLGSLRRGTDGNFYGMTNDGGTFGYGTIFKITPAGVYTVLRHLNSTADGSSSTSTLVQAPDGFLYGMCQNGGTTGYGTLFKISTSGAFSVLRHFSPGSGGGGAYPTGSLIVGTDGQLYGTTTAGGTFDDGVIFKITTTGTYTVLRSLTLETDGGIPKGTLYKGSDGNYYGTTSSGGSNLFGTVFKISSTGTYTVLARFNGGITGNAPQETLVQGKDNAFYGTTLSGGTADVGTIFKICGTTYTALRSFKDTTGESKRPKGSLIQLSDGNFYGTTTEGGSFNSGVIFKITPAGVITVLYNLSSKTDGKGPAGSLVQGDDGFLYGMAYNGGAGDVGTIFKVSTTGTFKVLRHLVGSTDGGSPEGNLVKGLDSNFYGMTSIAARIFKISPNGIFTVVRTLSIADGNSPTGSLLLGKDGNFYGMSSGGGAFSRGTIFKLTPAGVYTVLKSFNEAADGAYPKGNLVQGTDSSFYGMTSAGGSKKAGTIFKITPNGTFTVVRHFDLLKDGGTPLGSLIIQKNPLVANPQNVTTGEDTAKAIVLTGSGGTPLTYTITTQPKNGTITSGTSANRTYKPKLNYSGKDSFYFTVKFGCMSSAPAKVFITITPVNDSPVLAPIGNRTTNVGTPLTFTATATDVDAGQTKTFSLIGAPSGATINATSGAFSWTPTAAGSFTFKVRVTDNGSPVKLDEEQIVVTVTAAALTSSTPLITELQEHPTVLKAQLYPNPVRQKCIVKFNYSPGNVSAIVLDMKGSVLKNWTMKNTDAGILEFDMGRLHAGQYILKIQSADNAHVFKLIKQ